MANRRLPAAVAVLLAAEVLDELVFGAREAAWPLVRRDLGLSYAELGLLLGLSTYGGTLLEPFVGVLGDTRWRRLVVVAGGVGLVGGVLPFALAASLFVMLVAVLLLFVGAGAFVSLGQATLMDLDPDARERNMARWTVAGGVGAVAGPLVIAAVAGTEGGGGVRPRRGAAGVCGPRRDRRRLALGLRGVRRRRPRGSRLRHEPLAARD